MFYHVAPKLKPSRWCGMSLSSVLTLFNSVSLFSTIKTCYICFSTFSQESIAVLAACLFATILCGFFSIILKKTLARHHQTLERSEVEKYNTP
jgi:hypothetical protein